MRISRRTSGGRGEYEISEDLGGVSPRDLRDHRLTFRLGDYEFDTGCVLRLQGGKLRIRLLRPSTAAIHPHRQLAAALLMPAPVRADPALGSGRPVLRSERYAVEHVEIRDLQFKDEEVAVLTVGEVTLRNYNLHAELLYPARRLSDIKHLWEHATDLPTNLGELVALHEQYVVAGIPLPKATEELVATLQLLATEVLEAYGIFRQRGEDVLPDLQRMLLLPDEPTQPALSVDDVDPAEMEIKRRVVKEWRQWAANRGASSARFRQEVREAYRWTCIICGVHFPRTPFNKVAGVDAAHILPWAEYDLDHVCNGLSLCRLHHWAFDEALLTLVWDGNEYHVEVPDTVRLGLEEHHPGFSLRDLTDWAGPVPEERFPVERGHRPAPQLLAMLNQRLFENL